MLRVCYSKSSGYLCGKFSDLLLNHSFVNICICRHDITSAVEESKVKGPFGIEL